MAIRRLLALSEQLTHPYPQVRIGSLIGIDTRTLPLHQNFKLELRSPMKVPHNPHTGFGAQCLPTSILLDISSFCL